MSETGAQAQPPQDYIFHGLAEQFSQHIYHNPKGQIRLAIVQDDLQQHLPLFAQPSPSHRILDMGGGLGQMSLWFAKQGYNVTFVEPADDLFTHAQQRFQAEKVAKRIHSVHASVQTFTQTMSTRTSVHNQRYDLIIFHAVLEWLATPKATLQQLLRCLKPQGYLSLLFYNQHSAVMRSLLVADFQRIQQGQIAANLTAITHTSNKQPKQAKQSKQPKQKKGFTPISPLTPDEVFAWFKEWGYETQCWSGVRSFYDYMRPEARAWCNKTPEKLAELIEMEKRYAKQEPWRSMARYQHFIMKKT
ncbi:MAG: methyltransferase domain-containing protein [bacterium]